MALEGFKAMSSKSEYICGFRESKKLHPYYQSVSFLLFPESGSLKDA